MPSDPNARRDKALESIAGSLKDVVRLLNTIEKQTRPPRGVPYFARDIAAPTPEPGPYGTGTEPYSAGGSHAPV